MLHEAGEPPAFLQLGVGPGAVENTMLTGPVAVEFHLDHLRVLV
jgi:hypothetical protein